VLNGDPENRQHARPDVVLSELRTTVLSGQWARVATLCALISPEADRERRLLGEVAGQATLHVRAACVLGAAHHPDHAPSDPSADMACEDGSLALAMRRTFAALDGDRARAAALLRKAIPEDRSAGPHDLPLPRYDVAQLNLREQAGSLLRVIGVARPPVGDSFALGDAGSRQVLPVAGAGAWVVRGTPVEVLGQWDSARKVFECRSCIAFGHLPDYGKVCAAVEDLCARAGVAAEPMQVRMALSRDLDPSVARARHRRRLGEWNAVLAAAELFEDALRASRLSLETLAHVHEVTVGPATARAGQLRQTPAVIRWCGAITYRAPPVAAARSQARGYLRDLAAELQGDDSARHPAALAANAVASLTTSHPFADGNGRVARALATWLLLRSGFQRCAEDTLSTFLDAHLDEHYSTLRNLSVSPWGWHQLFYDAVLATFERPPAHSTS
jgi:hypothetical protein